MFIIYGTKRFDKTLGNLKPLWQCEHCNNAVHFRVFRVTTWFTIFWIPLFPVERKFFVTCPICNYGKKMQKKEAMELLENYNNSMPADEQNQ